MKEIIFTYNLIYSKIKERFSETSKNIFPLISGFLILLLIRSILAIMDTIFIQEEFPVQRIVFILSTALLIIGIEIGYTKFVFKLIDKTPSKLGDIFNYFHLLTKYIFGMILYYLILIILFSPFIFYLFMQYGFEFLEVIANSILDPYVHALASTYFNFNELFIIALFCFIPAFYIGIRLYFWNYFIIDLEYDGLAAIKKSWALTQNKSFELFVFGILFLLFNLLGALLLIGICFTMPMSYLFFCLYFRHLMTNQK